MAALIISVMAQIYFTMEKDSSSITNRIQAISLTLGLMCLYWSLLSSIFFLLIVSGLHSLDELGYILKKSNRLLKYPLLLLMTGLGFVTVDVFAFAVDLFSPFELCLVLSACLTIGVFAYFFIIQFLHTFHMAKFKVGVEHWRIGDEVKEE